MDSNKSNKLWRVNNKTFSQNQDKSPRKIVILEKRDLLMPRVQTNVKNLLDIADITSYYGICNITQ